MSSKMKQALLNAESGNFLIEPKEKASCKAQISNIDWSVDGSLICCCFKVENRVVIWNVNTCEMVALINANELGLESVNRALFMNLDSDYILLSGDKSLIYQISTKNVSPLSTTSQDDESMQVDQFGSTPGNASKKKGPN